MNYPPRTSTVKGSDFVVSMLEVGPGKVHDNRVFAEVCHGNVPDFMRRPVWVEYEAHAEGLLYRVGLSVAPDVFCIGTDEDFVRWPLSGPLAQKVADLIGASLITPKIATEIWKASHQLPPVSIPPSADMIKTRCFAQHHALIEGQRLAHPWTNGALVGGHKKDVVLAHTLPLWFPGNVAIFGWFLPSGKPIQGLNPQPGEQLTHEASYRDYSHGVRFIDNPIELKLLGLGVDDVMDLDLADVIADPHITELVNDALVGGKPYPYRWRYKVD